ncbi:MAG: hypothetical protein ACRCTE_07345 [Cellulosilyticaceae bacterium]
MKKVCIWIGIIILSVCGLSVGVGLSKQGKSIELVIEQYYNEYMPRNRGVLEILKQEQLEQHLLILGEKYPGDGERSIDVFILDDNNKIVARSSTGMSQSACYTVNNFIWNEQQIIFGDFKDSKYNKNSGMMEDINPKSIEVIFENGKEIKIDLGEPGIFVIVTKIKDEITEVNLYNEESEIVSELSETVFSKLELILLN